MPNKRLLVLALLGASMPALSARGAPASQAEADRLKTVFERYVGHPAPGETGGVTVTPEGLGYRVSLDLKQIISPLESLGISLEPATQTMLLTPNDNGTWRVTSDAVPPLVMHFAGQTLAVRSSSSMADGTFDPKIAAFSGSTGTYDGWTDDQETPTLTHHRRIERLWSSQKAASDGDNSLSNEVRYSFSDLTDQMIIRAPAPKASVEVAPTPPAVELNYQVPTGSIEVSLDRLHSTQLLDLWAFFVAHPGKEAIMASQDELRGLLRAALPLMGRLKETGALDGVTATTQMGVFSAHKMSGTLELADLAGSGKAALGLSFDGLSIPSADLPPWSAGFIPTAVDLKPTVVGFHWDEAAKEAVEDFDLKQDGFTPAQREKLARIAWPGDGGRVILAPSRITSGLLDLNLDGEATIGTVPTGRLTVTGTGIDKAIATLQSAAGTDETAARMLVQFVAAKNLAKPNPDGSFTWVIEAAGPGPLTVNGVPLK